MFCQDKRDFRIANLKPSGRNVLTGFRPPNILFHIPYTDAGKNCTSVYNSCFGFCLHKTRLSKTFPPSLCGTFERSSGKDAACCKLYATFRQAKPAETRVLDCTGRAIKDGRPHENPDTGNCRPGGRNPDRHKRRWAQYCSSSHRVRRV